MIVLQTGHALRYLSQFVVGFGIGFTSVWQLTLLTLAVVPLIAIAGGAYTIIMSTLSEKGEAAYAEAGKLAEEVNSNCFCVSCSAFIFFSTSAWSSRLFRRFVLCTHLWERTKPLNHTLSHLTRPSNLVRRAGLPKE